MYAYFKKFSSKEAALLKRHPDTTEEQWKELCDLFTSETFMHQLAKARDEIEAMRAAREKDLQEFEKKQAEMEATLRDCLTGSPEKTTTWTTTRQPKPTDRSGPARKTDRPGKPKHADRPRDPKRADRPGARKTDRPGKPMHADRPGHPKHADRLGAQ
ncbi:hypothetical protein CJ030_MR7G011478 [Morella rubra]|uniref:Uncharacterized protein n=1 Tax=Morella rubra TaxID=262757 RepID=A0A6A1V5Q1_9ROSI|nr:hypothetical protein CJ030_MR7G011478 [Morella rubra]